MDSATLEKIRQGRGRFMAMAATYGLGVFNDSFFRQSCILLAVAMQKGAMKGWIMAIFTLPYILFAWGAGWLADRYSKRRIVIFAKALEVVAMEFGAYGIMMDNWTCIMMMAFTMGLQSCIFSPALNGSIPELYPDCYVNKANSILKIIVTAMILGGVSIASVAMGREGIGPMGIKLNHWVVAGGVILIAILGFCVSFGVAYRPAADPKAKFPWSGPRETFRDLWAICHDRLFTGIVAADVFVWFAGTIIVLAVVQMAQDIGWGEVMGGYLVAAELVGVAIGGLASNYLTKYKYWYRLLGPLAILMGLCLVACLLIEIVSRPVQLPLAFGIMAAVGIFGGMYMVPCEAFVQIRPAPERKGAMIAAVNFVIFVGIFIAGPVEGYVSRYISSAQCLAATGGLGVLIGIILICTLSRIREIVIQGD